MGAMMNKVTIGKLNAIAVYLAWANLAFFVLFILAAFIIAIAEVKIPSGIDGIFIVYSLAAFIGFALIHMILSFFVRCPHCHKCLTIQGYGNKSTSPNGIMDGWSHVAIKWFSGTVNCIHCGSEVNTNSL